MGEGITINMFKIERNISRNIDKKADSVLNKLALILEKNQYRVIKQNEKIMLFEYYSTTLFEVRGASSNKLNNGLFRVDELSDEKIITLTYYVSYKYILLVASILILAGIFYDYFAFFTVIFLALTLIIELNMKKGMA